MGGMGHAARGGQLLRHGARLARQRLQFGRADAGVLRARQQVRLAHRVEHAGRGGRRLPQPRLQAGQCRFRLVLESQRGLCLRRQQQRIGFVGRQRLAAGHGQPRRRLRRFQRLLVLPQCHARAAMRELVRGAGGGGLAIHGAAMR